MKCAYCSKPLTKRQIEQYNCKHGKKGFPPKPVCSILCRGRLQRAPKKSERKERWAQAGGHDRAEKS